MLIGLFRGSIPRIFSKYKFYYDPTIFKFVSKKPISRKNRISLQLANNFHKRWTDCSLQTWPTSQIHFIILTCSNDRVDHRSPADGITVFDRGRCSDRVAIQRMLHFVIIRPSNDPHPPAFLHHRCGNQSTRATSVAHRSAQLALPRFPLI